jgi:hypothetical protein
MRRIILFCSVLLLLSCKSKKTVVAPTTLIVKPTEVAALKVSRAQDLGKRLLETCNTSRFKAFTAAEATEKVRQNATKEKIAIICKKINLRNGRFEGISLIDITHNKITHDYIFRYNINYEKKLNKRELYVTVDADNKVSAISTKEVAPKPM